MKLNMLLAFFFLMVGDVVEASEPWQGQWISARDNQSESNTWICFRNNFEVKNAEKSVLAKIAVDSKYWLWINGKQVIFEGGLKRGPNPSDTYYDEVDIGPFLQNGSNQISVLLWYFGKDGFSHNSSGRAALVFDCVAPGIQLLSNGQWKASLHPAFGPMQGDKPNFRLSESNIRFDARKDFSGWHLPDFKDPQGFFSPVVCLGKPPVAPWNRLVKRAIPQWKDYGLKSYESVERRSGREVDTLVGKLPYNAQVTPWLKLHAEPGKLISMKTDHYIGGGAQNVRAEYITKSGDQEYESLGWMNGQFVYYIVPKNLDRIEIKYRETGYDAIFAGSFSSNDPFLNSLWQKARRTLYVTMRDTFMDCPDRERAQWWGDLVIQAGQVFYTFSPETAALIKKAMYELIQWQRSDGTLFSPIPAGNWDKELPDQMLASVGYFGFWNYYINTGDLSTIRALYDGVAKYLGVWKLSPAGILVERHGDWYWGDWGHKIDKQLLFNGWYYLALKGMKLMSEALGKNQETQRLEHQMTAFKLAFNKKCWDGKGYRTEAYEGDHDDRGQALAVVSGLADAEKFPAILQIFKTRFLASAYMEKYVLEALYMMQEPDYALQRMKQRYSPMVSSNQHTTLWEGWAISDPVYGGGTSNHSWSGGGLTLMSQYIAGISPITPGFASFKVQPQLGSLQQISTRVPSISGDILVAMEKRHNQFKIQLTVPKKTTAMLHLPQQYKRILVNGKKWQLDRPSSIKSTSANHILPLAAGKYLVSAYL